MLLGSELQRVGTDTRKKARVNPEVGSLRGIWRCLDAEERKALLLACGQFTHFFALRWAPLRGWFRWPRVIQRWISDRYDTVVCLLLPVAELFLTSLRRDHRMHVHKPCIYRLHLIMHRTIEPAFKFGASSESGADAFCPNVEPKRRPKCCTTRILWIDRLLFIRDAFKFKDSMFEAKAKPDLFEVETKRQGHVFELFSKSRTVLNAPSLSLSRSGNKT